MFQVTVSVRPGAAIYKPIGSGIGGSLNRSKCIEPRSQVIFLHGLWLVGL